MFVRAKDAKSPRLTRSGPALRDVTLATLATQFLYASPAWSGFIKSKEKVKLQSVLNKTARYGFLPEWSSKTIDELLESSDITLFKAALKKSRPRIHPLLPPPKPPGYNLSNPNLTSSARILYIVCYLKTCFIHCMLLNHSVMTAVLIKETNERVTKFCGLDNLSDQIRRKFLHGRSFPYPAQDFWDTNANARSFCDR